MGYTPLFDTVLDGTLFGRWPHTGIWTCLLSQVDKHGRVDVNPALLAAKIGVPVAELLSCIADFMKPDPQSRTKDFEGRRLELIDPENRDWGWRVLNHQRYRDKARKAASDAERVSSGENKERKSAERQGKKEDAARRDPTRPDAARCRPPSDSDSDADSDANRNKEGEARDARRSPENVSPGKAQPSQLPEDFQLDDELTRYATTRLSGVNVAQLFDDFRNHYTANGAARSSWRATWCKWVGKAITLGYPGQPRSGQGAPKSETDVDRAWRRLRAEAASSGFRRAPREGETIDRYRLALRDHEREQADKTRQAMGEALARMTT
jgi:hypothetical protein